MAEVAQWSWGCTGNASSISYPRQALPPDGDTWLVNFSRAAPFSGQGAIRWHLATLVALWLMVMATPPAGAQETATVTGRVTDADTGAPLAGAQVAIGSGPVRAVSDARGAFTVSAVPGGARTFRIILLGYAEHSVSVDVVPGAIMTLDVTLARTALVVEGVTVVGEGGPQAEIREVRQSPFSVTVIDGRRLAGRGLTLDEALQRVTGVQVRRSGGLGSASVFNVRGLEGQRIQIYVDGNAANVVGDAFSLDDIPVQLVERIEVYKGVVPARFGGDGLGAAINVVTRHPAGGYADVGYTVGSYGQHQLSSVIQRPIGRGVQVAGTLNMDRAANDYTMESPFTPGLVFRRDHDEFRRTLGGVVLRFDRAWFDQLELAAVGMGSRREIQGIQTNVQHAEAGTSFRVLALEGDREGALGGRFDVRTAVIATGMTGEVRDTSSVRYTFEGAEYPSPNGRGELGLLPSASDNRTRLLRHRTTATVRLADAHAVNLTYVLDVLRYRPRDTLANRYAGRNVSEFPGRQTSAVVGLSHEWRPGDGRLVNVAGARGYAYRSEGTVANVFDPAAERPPPVTHRATEVGASEAVRYFVTSSTLLKGSVEVARRLPTSTELFGDGLLMQPAPDLRPERSLNLNLGVQYDRTLADGRRVQAEANAFRMQLRDMIRLGQGFAGTGKYANLGAVRIAGFDAEVRADVTGWLHGSASLTYQNARDVQAFRPGTTQPNPTRGLRLPNLPWLFGHGTVEVHGGDLVGPRQQSRVFYEASFAEEYFYAFEVSRQQQRRIPRALTHTMGLEHQWLDRGLTVSAEVQNLTDARVLNQLNHPLPGRILRVKLRYTWIGDPSPSPGRPFQGERH